jgi:Skp family chaperone for outer membrane proteins
LISFIHFTAVAQAGKSVRIGYIDMEYILQNVPDYAEAQNQLEAKAQKWKQEIELKKGEINKAKEALKTERALLTKELIEERQDAITLSETELLDYQQKRFGPAGDLAIQKSILVKPVQDQVFTAVQDLADIRKYDFIFDKSSDLTILFAAKRYDISDQVIRRITSSAKREQLSKKQLEQQEKKEYNDDLADENPALNDRRKLLEEKRAARAKLLEDRKNEAKARRERIEEERKSKQQGTNSKTATKPSTTTGAPPAPKDNVSAGENENDKTDKELARQAAKEANAAKLAERRRALEEKKARIAAEREAAKKAREDKTKTE